MENIFIETKKYCIPLFICNIQNVKEYKHAYFHSNA